MTVLSVTHLTTYRYRRPVRFGEHRLMVRPRDSHDLRLLDTTMSIRPEARVRWLHDTFSNSIALARFSGAATELTVCSRFRARHYPLTEHALELEPYARRLPFEYTAEDRADLGLLLERHHPDEAVAAWARDFARGEPELDTAALMAAMTRRIRGTFRYRRREEAGTQPPGETLRLGTGSCRDYARRLPFAYTDEDRADLGLLLQRHYPDDGTVAAWAHDFAAEPGMTGLETAALMAAMTRRIRESFAYRRREEVGTQAPAETLRLRQGTCRDYALFMMEAARSLGLAARYVSGYLYDDRLTGCGEGEGEVLTGGGATHAWVQLFLPGAGWVEFDPTNGLVGGRNLIRVAVTRDPTQAVPVSGTFLGTKADYLGMEVEVRVTASPGTE